MKAIDISEYTEGTLLLKGHTDPYIAVDNKNRWYMRFHLLYEHSRQAIIELLEHDYKYANDDIHIIQDEDGSLLIIEDFEWVIETEKVKEIYEKILHDVLKQ